MSAGAGLCLMQRIGEGGEGGPGAAWEVTTPGWENHEFSRRARNHAVRGIRAIRGWTFYEQPMLLPQLWQR